MPSLRHVGAHRALLGFVWVEFDLPMCWQIRAVVFRCVLGQLVLDPTCLRFKVTRERPKTKCALRIRAFEPHLPWLGATNETKRWQKHRFGADSCRTSCVPDTSGISRFEWVARGLHSLSVVAYVPQIGEKGAVPLHQLDAASRE
ncbi:hypothetical protein C8R47DRAFT_1068234 [Mycena vitilis]|nr:hypothetical protein C8R47DRAFT_1068234 [Mycena vitilis]